jgi:hypothetical protein
MGAKVNTLAIKVVAIERTLNIQAIAVLNPVWKSPLHDSMYLSEYHSPRGMELRNVYT